MIQGEVPARQIPYTAACHPSHEVMAQRTRPSCSSIRPAAGRDTPQDVEPRLRGGDEVGSAGATVRNGS